MSHYTLEALGMKALHPAHATVQGLRHSARLLTLGTLGALLASPLAAQELEMLDTYTAVGRGETRATNSLSLDDLDAALPGLSLEKSIDVLPGVNVTTTDPYGFYEFGSDIRLRSFRINQVAITMDGVPMGSNDARYGTRATRIVDSENIAGIDVSQGAGDLSTPAYEALGGSIKYRMRKPAAEAGAYVKITRGDSNARRTFARVDTGEILPGLTAYVSGSDFAFRTAGIPSDSLRRHVDVVLDYAMEKGSLSLQYSYNNRDDYDNATVSYAEYKALDGSGDYDYTDPSQTWLYILRNNGYQEYTPFMTYTTTDGQPLYADWRYKTDDQGNQELDKEGNPIKINFVSTTPTATSSAWKPDRWDMGDYSDKARNYGPPTYIDPSVGPGDGVNAINYNLWKNGRDDHFTRLVGEYEFSDTLKFSGNTYYQEKRNYGTWGVGKKDAAELLRAGYKAAPNRTDITAGKMLWLDANNNAVSYNTPGARAVDFAGNTVTPYSDAHAIVTPDTTALANAKDAIPGRTGRLEDFGGHRYGIYGTLEWEVIETNTVTVGGWYEYDRHGANRPNYNLVGGGINSWFAFDQMLFNNYFRQFESKHMMAFLQDTQSLLNDKLVITGGFKVLKVDRELDGLLSNGAWAANTPEHREVTYEDKFLPQIGATYTINDQFEVFSNYSENMSAPSHGTLADASGFNSGLSPEYAKNIDLGLRYTGKTIQASFAVYAIKYEDRVLAVPAPPGDSSFAAGTTTYRNVGGLDSYGFESGFDWRTPIENLKVVGSIAIQKTTFAEDLFIGLTDTAEDNDLYYTLPNPDASSTVTGDNFLRYENSSDKDLGNTPFLTLNVSLDYKWKDFGFNLGAKYLDDVYINTLNTEEIPSYVKVDASISWSGPVGSAFEGVKATFSADNLFDSEIWYASSYNSDTGELTADVGRNLYMSLEYSF